MATPPPPPELSHDAIGGILLRLPPGDPASLVRASLVCKSWRGLLSDDAFLREYRAFHGSPPVLGFFQDKYIGERKGTYVPQFFPTIRACPVPQSAIVFASGQTPSWCTADCRHGRVLFKSVDRRPTLVVWDPLTGSQKCFSTPEHPRGGFSAAVLCAKRGCNHLGCSGGPFFVVIASVYSTEDAEEDDDDGDLEEHLVAWASLYSSETGVWTASTSIPVDAMFDFILPSLLVRDAIYFIMEEARRILKYGLAGGVLSVIDGPPQAELDMIFAAAQDGELGVATMEGYSVHLWSWRATEPDRGGIGEWTRCKVIDLQVLIPFSIGNPSTTFELFGFAEGTGLVYVSANDDMFTVDLNSGEITKIGKRTSDSVIYPFMRFYTPDIPTARLQVPMRID